MAHPKAYPFSDATLTDLPYDRDVHRVVLPLCSAEARLMCNAVLAACSSFSASKHTGIVDGSAPPGGDQESTCFGLLDPTRAPVLLWFVRQYLADDSLDGRQTLWVALCATSAWCKLHACDSESDAHVAPASCEHLFCERTAAVTVTVTYFCHWHCAFLLGADQARQARTGTADASESPLSQPDAVNTLIDVVDKRGVDDSGTLIVGEAVSLLRIIMIGPPGHTEWKSWTAARSPEPLTTAFRIPKLLRALLRVLSSRGDGMQLIEQDASTQRLAADTLALLTHIVTSADGWNQPGLPRMRTCIEVCACANGCEALCNTLWL